MGMMIIKAIMIDQIKIPFVEPTPKSISSADRVGIGVGVAFCDIVAPGPKAALKKANATPMMRNKTVREGGDSFFIKIDQSITWALKSQGHELSCP